MKVPASPQSFGMFALLTLLVCGAAVGQRVGLALWESLYLTLLVLGVIGWLAGRSRRKG
jgi:hypothetical protein